MIAKGFQPVAWVGAVATAALLCYMLSLQVAAERADLASIERQIIASKQNIRALQTELGTRGRLSQLERWNADVLALSAPTATQFLDNELLLARFDVHQGPAAPEAPVRLAAAETAPTPRPSTGAPRPTAPAAVAPAVRQAVAALPDAPPAESPVRRASLAIGLEDAKPAPAPAPAGADQASSRKLLDDAALRELRAVARAEREGGAGN